MSPRVACKLASVILPLLAAMLGCGSLPEGTDLNELQHPIVNGSADPDHSAVGLLLLQTGSATSHCTGTLIGSRTVLTAAHCVNQSGSYSFLLNGRQVPVESRVWHQEFSKSGSIPGYASAYLNDVGLATLSEEITDVAPVLLTYPAPTEGATIKVVGLGMTTPGDPDTIGERQITTSTIGTADAAYFIYGMKIDAGGGNPCYGDSGGPTFIELFGRDHLLGVHSMGDEACSAYGYDMAIGAYASWIAAEAGSNLGVSGIDAEPPLILISSPAQGAVVPTSFSLEVVALDDRSGLQRIELLLDDQHQGEAGASPATFALESVSEGPHLLTVRATDRIGRSADAELELTVDARANEDPQAPWTELNGPGDQTDHRLQIIGTCDAAGAAGGATTLPATLTLLGLLWARQRRRRRPG